MSIAWPEFERCCRDIAERSSSLGDGWTYVVTKPRVGFGVLEKSGVVRPAGGAAFESGATVPVSDRVHTSEKEVAERVLSDLEDSDVEDMDVSGTGVSGAVAVPPTDNLRRYDYSIAFSATYGVPVLYFNGAMMDGRRLSAEGVWADVPAQYQATIEQSKWTFITQQEHPVRGRPFYYLHPCETAALMKDVLASAPARNYVASWLNLVGPIVGLSLSREYFIA